MDIPVVTRDAMGLNLVADELKRARKLHAPYHSSHEAYAVILEELDEYWDEVKKKGENRNREAMCKELIQIATTAIRAMSDLNLIRKL